MFLGIVYAFEYFGIQLFKLNIMRLNKFLIMFSFMFITLTSCKDNERESETIEPVETTDENFNENLSNARSNNDVVNAVESNPELSTFATGLNAWNVEDSIGSTEGEMLIFAPTNLAYSEVAQREGQQMISLDSEEIISYHILNTSDDLAQLRQEIRNTNGAVKVQTMQGEELELSLDGNSLVLTGATGVSARVTDSIQAGNGMVYVIDKVLLPRDTNKEVRITNEG